MIEQESESNMAKLLKPTLPPTPVTSIVSQKRHGFEWIDLGSPKEEDLLEVEHKYKLHEVDIRHVHGKKQISQLNVEDDYIFLILHFPHLIASEKRIVTSQVSIFIGKDFLITVHDQRNAIVRNCFNDVQDRTDEKTPGKVVVLLIEHLLKDVEMLLAGVSMDLDKIEDDVFSDANSDAFEIGLLRHRIMRLRRVLAMQKIVLEDLDAAIDTFTGEHLSRYYRSNTNMSRKLWEEIEEAKESIEIYKDADFTTSTEQTNKILAVLTLLFTLTIPGTTIGAFYGMNVLIPGGISAGSWTFFGPYTTFEIIMLVSLLAALAMLLYFRRKKWF